MRRVRPPNFAPHLGEDGERWWDVYGQLHGHWAEGRLDEARLVLEQARSDFSDEPTFMLAEAQQLALEQRPDADEQSVRRAVSLVRDAVPPSESQPPLLVTAILLLFDLGDYASAAAYLQRLRPYLDQLHPKDAAGVAHVVADLLMRAGRPDEAEEQLLVAVENDPAEPMYAASLARKLLGDGRVAEARRVIADARRCSPRDQELVQLHDQLCQTQVTSRNASYTRYRT